MSISSESSEEHDEDEGPPGLEDLIDIDSVHVLQQPEFQGGGIDRMNRYVVMDSSGDRLYWAEEDSTACCRCCCGNDRSFVMRLLKGSGFEAFRIRRSFKCFKCSLCACLPCFAEEVTVESPPGRAIGYVRQRCSFMSPKYSIKDEDKDTWFKITGPMCFCQNSCCREDIIFSIVDAETNESVGRVTKEWGGAAKEKFTNADNFSITFPEELEVQMKAVLIGSLFLIDFMYFEKKVKSKKQKGGMPHGAMPGMGYGQGPGMGYGQRPGMGYGPGLRRY